MTSGPADYRKRLEAISSRTNEVLTTANQELAVSAELTASLLRDLREERAQTQSVIDQFTVTSLMVEAGVSRDEPGASYAPVLDLHAIHHAMAAMDTLIADGQATLVSLTLAREAMEHARGSLNRANDGPAPDTLDDLRIRQASVAAREDERGRMAREMHDGPAQVFANAIFGIEIAEQIARRDPERVADELRQLRQLLRDGVGEMRRFMSELRPAMLTDRGLIPTLQRYIADFNRFFGRHVILDAEPLTVRLTEDQQLALFRIVQESLQNIQKHSGTQNGRVTIRQYEDEVILEIVDEGRGFDSDRAGGPGSGGGAGLPGMRERARLIGARLSVASAPGAGVTVRLVLPLIYRTGPAQAPARDEENAR